MANRGSRFNPMHVIRKYNDRVNALRNIEPNQQQGASSPLLANAAEPGVDEPGVDEPGVVPALPAQSLEQDRETSLLITRNGITDLARGDLDDAGFVLAAQALVNQYTHIGIDLSEVSSSVKRHAVLDILSHATHLGTVELNAAAMPENFQAVLTASNAIAANNSGLSGFRLDVRHNGIRDAGARALAANSAITSLDVSHNFIGADGAEALAANRTITSLDMSHNFIRTAGAQALADNSTIRSLYVSDNNIGAAGVRALEANLTITRLDVSGNELRAGAPW